jgi:ferredoxin
VDHQRKGDLRPSLKEQRCIGCGVCSTTCRSNAISMVSRPEKPEVPETTVERLVLMALERGNLPHLVFDAGQSRSSNYFNQILQVLVKLPVADRFFASKQLHSRFIKRALGKVDIPMGN